MPWAEDEFETSDLAGTWMCEGAISEDSFAGTEVVFDSSGKLTHWFSIDGDDVFDGWDITTNSSVDSEGNVRIYLMLSGYFDGDLEEAEIDLSGPMNTSKSRVTLFGESDYFLNGDMVNSETFILFLER
jgi:hypothetical protein